MRCIAQDQFGYIWIGTVGAVNRFDGKTVTQYSYAPGDSTSLYSSQPHAMHSDREGRFWIGMETGLMEYDFRTNRFKRIAALKDKYISAITSVDDTTLFVLVRKNIMRYHKKTGNLYSYNSEKTSQHALLKGLAVYAMKEYKQQLYLATQGGIFMLHLPSNQVEKITWTDSNHGNFTDIDVNASGTCCAYDQAHGMFYLFRSNGVLIDSITDWTSQNKLERKPEVTGFLFDKHEHIWIITRQHGLFRYDINTHTSEQFLHHNLIPNSAATNSYRCIFRDNNQVIWLGCDVEGISFFEPDQRAFSTILNFPEELQFQYNTLGRAVAVDHDHNIWMGNHDGLSKYNVSTRTYEVWRNEAGHTALYSNIIRSIYCDTQNNIWIGTGSGVNCYHSSTKQMEFIDPKKLPRSWYNAIQGDRSGTIWFCTNDSASLYWYNPTLNNYNHIGNHPLLKKYKGYTPTSYFFEDSKHRYWISFSRKGAVMVDPAHHRVKQYQADEQGGNHLIGNQVIEIQEDREGYIWFSTFNGVSRLNPETEQFQSWNRNNGLPGNMAGPLAVDEFNQVWVGVNGGLVRFATDRNKINLFTLSDGLPSVGFHEHAGTSTPVGDMLFPTYNGYVMFNPKNTIVNHTLFPFYVASYSLQDSDQIRLLEANTQPTISLKANQHSFTFNLVALNYINPSQTWFAYKLQGFEQNWHYTKDPKAVYTNVPGGNYQFLFKASNSNYSWNMVAAKQLDVALATVFYKAT